jgi:hypothetical protein
MACHTHLQMPGIFEDVKDLEPILNTLCNYQAGFLLSPNEAAVLGEWLKESKQHQVLFEELGNWTRIYMGNIHGNPRERIQRRLIEMEEGS